MRRGLLQAFTALFAAAPLGLLAHHSVAVKFDSSRSITIDGVLTEVAWRNPHSGDTRDEDPQIQEPFPISVPPVPIIGETTFRVRLV